MGYLIYIPEENSETNVTYTVEYSDGRVLRGIPQETFKKLKDGVITFDELYNELTVKE